MTIIYHYTTSILIEYGSLIKFEAFNKYFPEDF